MSTLEIGGGATPLYRPNMDIQQLPGVDVVHDMTVYPWPFPNSSFGFVYMSHVLEHAPAEHVKPILNQIWRILKPGGRVEIHVPDIEEILKINDWYKATSRIFGNEAQPHGTHRCGFWMNWLRSCLQDTMYGDINIVQAYYNRSVDVVTPELVATARKVCAPCFGLKFGVKH